VRLRHPIDREILALAVPALGALAADPLVSLVDTAFVGRLGVVPLGALGVNAAVFSLAFVAFNFLAYGTTPMVARAVGRGDTEAAGRIALHALALAGIAGIAALHLLQIFARPVLLLMGAQGPLAEPALEYLRIRAFAGPAVLFVTAGHGIFRGWHDTRTPLVVTLGLNAVNLALDPLLIFGLGWGIRGAAVATAVAQWAGALWFLWLILGPRRHRLGVTLHLPRPRDLVPFLRVGGALVTRTLALVATMTLATAVATRLGPARVAAHQVASQLWILLALVVDSLAVAAQAMVARHRGADEAPARPVQEAGLHGHTPTADTARATGTRLLGWGLATGFAHSLALVALRPWIPRLFTDAPDAIALLDAILPFVIWMQPLNGLVFVLDGIFMGAERFRFLALQTAIAAAAATAVLLLVLPMGWGLAGVWWGLVALMAVRGVTLGVRWRAGVA
jgi:putative MATE family efflux protein